MWSAGFRQRAEHGLVVGQRNAADEMHDRMLLWSVIALVLCGKEIWVTTSWRGSPPRSGSCGNIGQTFVAGLKAVARATAIATSRRGDRRQEVSVGGSLRAGDSAASALAAAMNIASVTARPRGDHAEADAREDVGVVGLVDLELAAIPHQRRERAAGADDGAAVAPAWISASPAFRAEVGLTAGRSSAGGGPSAMARTIGSLKSPAGPTRRSAPSAWRCARRRAMSRVQAARPATPPPPRGPAGTASGIPRSRSCPRPAGHPDRP